MKIAESGMNNLDVKLSTFGCRTFIGSGLFDW